MFKKKTFLAFLVSVATVVAASPAHAGSSSQPAVVIDLAARFAYGSPFWTRNTPDHVSAISCTVQSDQWGGSLAFCQASSATEKQAPVFCQSSEPEMVKTARSISGYDTISFGWNAIGDCTFLSVRHGSESQPLLR